MSGILLAFDPELETPNGPASHVTIAADDNGITAILWIDTGQVLKRVAELVIDDPDCVVVDAIGAWDMDALAAVFDLIVDQFGDPGDDLETADTDTELAALAYLTIPAFPDSDVEYLRRN